MQAQGPCTVCGELGHACSVCFLDFYCSLEHQKDDWPHHQAGCGALELRAGWLVATKNIPAGTRLLRPLQPDLGHGKHPATGSVGSLPAARTHRESYTTAQATQQVQVSSVMDVALLLVLQRLSLRDLLSCRAVCRHWSLLAMHPMLWEHFDLPGDLGGDLEALTAALRLAPCAASLSLDVGLIGFDAPGTWLPLAASTNCAVTNLELALRSGAAASFGEAVLRNQLARGRLCKLNFQLTCGCDDSGWQAVLDAACRVLGAEGLEELHWECYLPPGSAGAALPPAPVRSSLRRLRYKVCGETEPLQYLLSSHAATLEAVTVTLRGDGRGVAMALALLTQLPKMTSFGLCVEGRFRTPMKVLKDLLQTTSPKLRCVELRITDRYEEQLLMALGASGRAAVQSLDLSGPQTVHRAKAIISSLNNLRLLQELRLRCVPDRSFIYLLTVPGGLAQRLRRLEFAVPGDVCPHLYAHSHEVHVLLRANTLLTVALRPGDPLRWSPRGTCGVCLFCGIGCHTAAWRPRLGLLEITGQEN